MNAAHPASLPPVLSSSGGIKRSTAASTREASSAEKNVHGPGRAGIGGDAAPGSHGSPPVMMRAYVAAVLAITSAAVDASRDRREILISDCVCMWTGSAGDGLKFRGPKKLGQHRSARHEVR